MSSSRRTCAYVFGGIAAAALIAIGSVNYAKNDVDEIFCLFLLAAVLSFTFISCLILDNNIVGEIVVHVFSWGFVSFPKLIFSFSCGGISWFFAMKLLFAVLGIAIALCMAGVAIVLGAFISFFVYPYAIKKAYEKPAEQPDANKAQPTSQKPQIQPAKSPVANAQPTGEVTATPIAQPEVAQEAVAPANVEPTESVVATDDLQSADDATNIQDNTVMGE